MSKIIVIGAGFAGLSAASCLARLRRSHEVTLIDRKTSSCFLPLLPDCIGRGILPRHLSFSVDSFCKRSGIRFLNKEVEQILLDENRLLISGAPVPYDYLIIASGSETNFYGNKDFEKGALKLDDGEDAVKIKAASQDASFENYIISGGGYAGVEVATNLRLFMDDHKRNPRVIIVERAPAILGSLPEWMKEYVLANLRKMRIDVKCATSIERIQGSTATLSSKEMFERSCVVWTAGVATSRFLQEFKKEKNPQGRVKVDEYLRLSRNCFVIGDASFVNDNGAYLRMAVQFAITQGQSAARNLLRSIKGEPLVKYRPLDFGYVIPMANNRACGRIMGIDMKGMLPVFLHYGMCVFRSYGFKNKWGVIRYLLKGGRRC